MAQARKVVKPRQKKNGYVFPEQIPPGEIFKDVAKREWSLGPSIGKGGFGEIYCAKEGTSSKGSSFPFVIKVEPHENGPLFVEKHFYLKVAKTEDVESWKKSLGIKTLGIPMFHGFGSHEFKNQKYRFVVMERFGRDIWSIFLDNNKVFPNTTVYKCAIQIIDALQYIHSKGYVHADIKGGNLLLGLKKGTENHVFLVDFGLACKYSVKDFARDPKRCHNGTIEYTSRDWHMGVPTRRGDMEILGFNLVHWVTSSLPWEGDIKCPDKVHKKKEEMMAQVKTYCKTHYPNIPNVIVQYLQYISSLKFDEEPDYDYCRELFQKELKQLKCSPDGKLDFVSKANGMPDFESKANGIKAGTAGSPPRKKKRKVVAEIVSDEEIEESDEEPPAPAIEEKKKPVKRTRKAANEEKPSWKDAPTIKASNIVRPGEYERKSSPRATKQRTKKK